MTVPDFDAAAVELPEPPRFRLLGREWACHPTVPDEAMTAARMGHVLAPFAVTDPEVYAAVISDLALRFVGWCVTDPDEWARMLAGARVEAATIIGVMAWLAEAYDNPTPPAAAPAPATPRPGGARRTNLEQLRGVLTATGLPDTVIED